MNRKTSRRSVKTEPKNDQPVVAVPGGAVIRMERSETWISPSTNMMREGHKQVVRFGVQLVSRKSSATGRLGSASTVVSLSPLPLKSPSEVVSKELSGEITASGQLDGAVRTSLDACIQSGLKVCRVIHMVRRRHVDRASACGKGRGRRWSPRPLRMRQIGSNGRRFNSTADKREEHY